MLLQNQHLATIHHTEQALLITEVQAAVVPQEVTALHLLQQNQVLVQVLRREAVVAATVVVEVVAVVAHLTQEVQVAQEVQEVQEARVAEVVVVVQDHLQEEDN